MNNRLVKYAAFVPLFLALPSYAWAECVVPNVIANGQVADASKVMDNFTAIANCVDAGVKPNGTPQDGQIAVFSGSQTVTGGNLSGDVTTSGGTSTSLSVSGVTPGTYINPNITVDAKGRVIAATNGVGGGQGGGTSDWTELTLINPGAETGNISGWTMTGGGFVASTTNPSGHTMTPISGSYAFVATANASPKMSQSVDLSTFAAAIDSGAMFAMLESYSAETSTGENPYMYIEFNDAAGIKTAVAATNPVMRDIGFGIWRYMNLSSRVPPLTRSINVVLYASRLNGTVNNVAFDWIRAYIKGF